MNLMDQALLLRKEGHLKESNEMLIQLAEHEPDNPKVN